MIWWMAKKRFLQNSNDITTFKQILTLNTLKMKKVIFAIALTALVGSISTTSFAQDGKKSKTTKSVKKDDGKKKSCSKDKKGCCSSKKSTSNDKKKTSTK